MKHIIVNTHFTARQTWQRANYQLWLFTVQIHDMSTLIIKVNIFNRSGYCLNSRTGQQKTDYFWLVKANLIFFKMHVRALNGITNVNIQHLKGKNATSLK